MKNLLSWALRIIPALILLQTLAFKFTAHPDSVALFSQLGLEPIGRIGIGSLELVAGILLLIPATTRFGALLASGLMFGAVASHLTVLGINYNGDGGILFAMAVIVLVTSLFIVFKHRQVFKAEVNQFLGRSDLALGE